MSIRERAARAICEAHGIDPDQKSVGLGKLMPKGKMYFLWEAQLSNVDAVIRAQRGMVEETLKDLNISLSTRGD